MEFPEPQKKRKRSRNDEREEHATTMVAEEEAEKVDDTECRDDDFDAAVVLSIFKSSPDRQLTYTLNIEKLQLVLAAYKDLWVPVAQEVDTEKLCASAIQRFDIRKHPDGPLVEPCELSHEDVENAYKRELFRWVSLQQVFRFHSMLDTGRETQAFACSERATDNSNTFQSIIDAIVAARALLSSAAIAFKKMHGGEREDSVVGNLDPFGYVPIKVFGKTDEVVEIALFLLKELAKREYMRKGSQLWEPIRVSVPKEAGGDPNEKTLNSHAWQRVAKYTDISQFVSEVIDKESHYTYWSALLAKNCRAKVLEYLVKDANDIEFHTLEPNRCLFSFRNGVLNTMDCKFHPFFIKQDNRWVQNPAIHSDWISSNFFDADFNVRWPTLDTMKTDFETEMPSGDPKRKMYGFWAPAALRVNHDECIFQSRWFKAMAFMMKHELITPKFDKIFEEQLTRKTDPTKGTSGNQNPYWGTIKQTTSVFSNSFRSLEGKVKKDGEDYQTEYLREHKVSDIWAEEYAHLLFWHFALIGRLLFPVGKLDNWQIIQFFKGVAGTGKSTLINVISDLFAKEDTEAMSNTGPRGGGKGIGGLANFLGKALWKVPEVKGDFGLDQSTFQSMISGEVIAVDMLYKESISVKWEVPGLLAGNDFAGWRDNSGSILRRVVVSNFSVPLDPSKKDPTLEADIKREIPAILYKSLLCYRLLTWLHVKKDVWNILPKYFWWTRSRLAAFTDPLSNYLEQQLEDGEYEVVKDGVMTWEQFTTDFLAWGEANEIPRKRIVEYKMDIEKVKGAFKDRNVLVLKVEAAGRKEIEARLLAQTPSIPAPTSSSYYVLDGITKKSKSPTTGSAAGDDD